MGSILQLRSDRGAMLHELRALIDRAEAEGRDFTAAEKVDADRLQARIDQATADISRQDADDQHARNHPTVDPHRGAVDGPEYRALSIIDRTGHLTDEQRTLADRLVRHDPTGTAGRIAAATGDEHYLRAWVKLARDPQRGHLEWTDDEQRAFAHCQAEARAMSLVDAAGGFMVPFTLDPAIMLTNDGAISPIRAAARVVTTSTDQWQGVTSAGVTTRWAAEASQANDDSPTLAAAPIPVHKADSFVPYSIEVGSDVDGFVNEIRRIMLDAVDVHEAAAFANGTGDGQPQGIIRGMVDSAVDDIAPAVAEQFNPADVYALLEAVPPRFRAGASWFAELSTINAIDQFETTNGSKQFPEVGAARPVLLRRMLREVSDMDGVSGINPAATAANRVLLAGDVRAGYTIVDRIGAQVELVPHLFGADGRPTGQRGLYLYWRVGASVVVPQALRVLNVATTA